MKTTVRLGTYAVLSLGVTGSLVWYFGYSPRAIVFRNLSRGQDVVRELRDRMANTPAFADVHFTGTTATDGKTIFIMGTLPSDADLPALRARVKAIVPDDFSVSYSLFSRASQNYIGANDRRQGE